MARYKYLGQPLYPNAGPCLKIIVKQSSGVPRTLLPISPATTFPIGNDIGYDITDPVSIKQLGVDDRFEVIP